ncbi:unnamed protein product [Prunus armeniaca]|uniref:Uncharacterized protein n=1 Tax=Prunus armeniaca TaxID=36596 RepID=A0A6J5U2M5_PRUAR|nr:unnamed protein product [Prunus armeniaca]CAB4299251.1 unnamed protein product [Prunus armeniaca]
MSLWATLFFWLGKRFDCLLAAIYAIVDILTMQLNLIEDEHRPIVVEGPMGDNRQVRRFFLVGRLLTLKDFKVQFFMRTMKKLWSPRACVEICQLENGVKGVPLAYMERCTGKLIGDILGWFLETDSGRGEVRSRLVWIKYEKLPNYCYLCGICDHVLNQCSLRESVINHGEFKPFSPWLKAEVKEWLGEPEMDNLA